MNIERVAMGKVAVLRLAGEVDADGVKQLRIALLDCLKAQQPNVAVNLGGVAFMSYMGVGVLVDRLRHFRANGGDLVLVNANLHTQRMLRMAGIKNVFRVADSETQAMQVLREAA